MFVVWRRGTYLLLLVSSKLFIICCTTLTVTHQPFTLKQVFMMFFDWSCIADVMNDLFYCNNLEPPDISFGKSSCLLSVCCGYGEARFPHGAWLGSYLPMWFRMGDSYVHLVLGRWNRGAVPHKFLKLQKPTFLPTGFQSWFPPALTKTLCDDDCFKDLFSICEICTWASLKPKMPETSVGQAGFAFVFIFVGASTSLKLVWWCSRGTLCKCKHS